MTAPFSNKLSRSSPATAGSEETTPPADRRPSETASDPANTPSSYPSYDALLGGLVNRDRFALARCITVVESRRPEDADVAARLLDDCLSHGVSALRLGITGAPGVGKSSFIESFGYDLVENGHRIAVLAVDPSSTMTRGSVLADKTRMPRLANHPDAFVRPSPTGGHAGGTARATRDVIALCEAAGYDVIIVETVGVGQSETALAQTVDFFALMVLTGAGDELQGMKRGVLEMSDAILVSKSDGENIAAAERTAAIYRDASHVLPGKPFGWQPRVIRTSSVTGEGLAEFWATISSFRSDAESSGFADANRKRQLIQWMREALVERLREALLSESGLQDRLAALEQDVLLGRLSPRSAVQRLLEERKEGRSS
jgi:LAO/AO transport system kinase